MAGVRQFCHNGASHMQYINYGYRNQSDNDAANLGYLAQLVVINGQAADWLDGLVPGEPYVCPEVAALDLGYADGSNEFKHFLAAAEHLQRFTKIYVCPWSHRVLDVVDLD